MAGDIVTARIAHADEYDLWGKGVGDNESETPLGADNKLRQVKVGC